MTVNLSSAIWDSSFWNVFVLFVHAKGAESNYSFPTTRVWAKQVLYPYGQAISFKIFPTSDWCRVWADSVFVYKTSCTQLGHVGFELIVIKFLNLVNCSFCWREVHQKCISISMWVFFLFVFLSICSDSIALASSGLDSDLSCLSAWLGPGKQHWKHIKQEGSPWSGFLRK